MNSFAKKWLVVAVLLQLTLAAFSVQPTLNLGGLPLWFEADRDASGTSQFVAHGRDSEIAIKSDGVQFTLRQSGGQVSVARMEFAGGNMSAGVSGADELPGKVNYLTGGQTADWRSEVAAFGRVRIQQIYSGIDLVCYGTQQRLEYDFDVAPGIRPETIALRFSGVDRVSVDREGSLVVTSAGREIVQDRPVAYQTVGGVREPVQVGYKILDAHTVAFSVGHFDSRLPLVIDPVLAYSTFFGGNGNDCIWAIALGTNDNSVYVAGRTISTKISSSLYFTTYGAAQTNFGGGGVLGDAFVAKFHDPGTTAEGLADLATNLIYCTYLGGSADDCAYALAVDATGHAYVGGITFSTNFPHVNPLDFQLPDGKFYNGSSNQAPKFVTALNAFPSDGFVAKLETNGSSLLFSSYLGGDNQDVVSGVALDAADNIYVTGYTYSTNFPVTADAYQTNFRSAYNSVGCNVFVSEIASNGTSLNYSTYFGGTNVDLALSLSFNNGFLAVAGATCSSNFPSINWLGDTNSPYYSAGPNYFDEALLNGRTNNLNNNFQINPYLFDAFVTLFYTNGTALTPLYSTFLGGTNTDLAYAVAVNSAGTVYVAGATTSTNFPNTTDTNQAVLSSYMRTNTVGILVTNAFLTQIIWNPAGGDPTNGYPSIGYSQIFGGIGNDYASAVSLDAAGDVFVAGITTAFTNYNTLTNIIGSLNPTNSGASDVFVTAFKSDLSGLLYSADFGSSRNDYAWGIAVDADGNAYVAGHTLWQPGSNVPFPVFNAWEATPPDDDNGFLTKIWLNTPVPALTTSNYSTNLFITWSSIPEAQIATNSFYLETTTNLYSSARMTNFIFTYMTNVVGTNTIITTITNKVPYTNFMAPAKWTAVTVKPSATNIVSDGVTNQIYTYKFNPTNQMRFFQLKGY